MQTGSGELERVKSQLQQERQLRAVTEVCLMEDRVSWQQVSAIAADTLQTCSLVQTGLNDIRFTRTVCLVVDRFRCF